METLNFLYVKYFCDTVILEGLTAAAKVNFVTPSAISQGIIKLEQSLQCALLYHHPNRLRLTPAGEFAFQRLHELLKQTNDFQKHFSNHAGQFLGNLAFACTFTLSAILIPPYLKKFHHVNPSVKIQIHTTGDIEEKKRLIRNNIVDFAIIPQIGSPDLSGFEKQTVYEMAPQICVSRNIDPKEEKQLKFILPNDVWGTYFEQLYTSKYQKAPEVLLRSPSPIVIAGLIKEGLGIGILPDCVFKQDPSLRLSKQKFKLPNVCVEAIFLSGMTLRKSSEIFLSYLQSV